MSGMRDPRLLVVVAGLLVPAFFCPATIRAQERPSAEEDAAQRRQRQYLELEDGSTTTGRQPWEKGTRDPREETPDDEEKRPQPRRSIFPTWPEPQLPESLRQLQERPGAPIPLEEPVDPDRYVCGPGDILDLHFWGSQNFTWKTPIGPAGRLFIRKVGFVEVAGLTLTAARAAIRKTVKRYYPGLKFDVSLRVPRTFMVHVVANVRHPGIYLARGTDRVSRLLERAGGLVRARFNRFGRGSYRRITVTRRDGKKEPADLLLYYLTGDRSHNPYVLDGDVITVPFAELEVTVSGPVNRPGRYELVATKDLVELVSLAGGLRPSATAKLPIRVVRRGTEDRDQQLEVKFAGPGRPLAHFALRADDQVIFPSSAELQRSLFLVGAVVGGKPADETTSVHRMIFKKGDSVRTLIERAGGVGPSADLTGAYLIRGKGAATTIIPIDLEALLIHRDFAADRKLQMGDSVVVPYKRRAIAVEGAVMRPGLVQFNPKLRIHEYIAYAGGTTKMARSRDNIRVVTSTGKTKNYDDNPKLEPGDTIVVPERTFSPSEVAQIVISAASLAIASVALVLSVR